MSESVTCWPSTPNQRAALSQSPNPCGSWDIVGSGPDQGKMVASLIPFNLQVTATRASSAGEATSNAALTPTGASVNLTRTVRVCFASCLWKFWSLFAMATATISAGPNFQFRRPGPPPNEICVSCFRRGPYLHGQKLAAVGPASIFDRLENGHLTFQWLRMPPFTRPMLAVAARALPHSGPRTSYPLVCVRSIS